MKVVIASSSGQIAMRGFKLCKQLRKHDTTHTHTQKKKPQNYFSVTNLREINIYNLSNKEFKIAVLRKLGEL